MTYSTKNSWAKPLPLRKEIVITSKFRFDTSLGFDPRGMKKAPGWNCRLDYIKQGVEGFLKQLNIETIK